MSSNNLVGVGGGCITIHGGGGGGVSHSGHVTVGGVGAAGPHTHAFTEPAMRQAHTDDWWSAWNNSLTPLGQLAVRLKLNPFMACPFEFLQVHAVGSGKFLVFVVQNGEPIVLTDGDLFPSDGLITQLRLLMKDVTP